MCLCFPTHVHRDNYIHMYIYITNILIYMYCTHIIWKELYVQRNPQHRLYKYSHTDTCTKHKEKWIWPGGMCFPKQKALRSSLCPLSQSHSYATQAAHLF